jgi:hypothetical protein
MEEKEEDRETHARDVQATCRLPGSSPDGAARFQSFSAPSASTRAAPPQWRLNND